MGEQEKRKVDRILQILGVPSTQRCDGSGIPGGCRYEPSPKRPRMGERRSRLRGVVNILMQ